MIKKLSPATIFGLVVLLVILVSAVMAPWIAPYGMNEIVGKTWEQVSSRHLLGTDQLGRDFLTRLLYGANITILVAGAASILAFIIGSILGFISATCGVWIDQITSRINDLIISIPTLIFALVVLSVLEISIANLILVMAILDSTRVFRLSRVLAYDIIVNDYVEAAKLRGERLPWIIFAEILPNTTGPLLAEFGLRFAFAILFLSSLSFLGLGVQPPLTDWGSMVRENKDGIPFGISASLIPAGVIAFLAICINLTADSLLNSFSKDKRA